MNTPEQAGQSMDSRTAVMKFAAEAQLSNLAAQDTNNSNSTNDNAIPRKATDPAGEESESELWMDLVAVAHVLVAGETFQTHETFIKKLNMKIEQHSTEKCDVILVFCPVVSRIGTDMEAAMSRVSEDKPVILVFMHHCHHPSHMTNITVQPSRGNIVQVIHCAFHETKGLLECQENEQAVDAVGTTLLRLCRFVDFHTEVPESKATHTQLDMDQRMNVSTMEHFTAPSGDGKYFTETTSSKKLKYSSLVHVMVAGETFSTHDKFIEKLELEIERCSAEDSNIILVFCPVVSQIMTDMEAAMSRVTEDKPVILVFMHHFHDSSHMTNITVQPCRSNIVQVVHCAFHETKGLLECQENEQAVTEVNSTLKKY